MSSLSATLTLGLCLAATPVSAQHVPLAELLPRLVLSEIVLQSPPTIGVPGNPDGFSHLAHFSPLEAGELNNPVVGIVQGFNSQLATQFATFPLGSSTGGLTYVFDETLGTFRRGSASFGPLFGERALTIGRRKLSAGFNYQRTSYKGFEGRSLDDGSIKFYLRHEDCCTVVFTPEAPGFNLTLEPNGTRLNPPLEGDLIEASLSMDATTNTIAAFANYGLTDRWDVGIAVPFVQVTLDARVVARMLRLVTAIAPLVHTFDRANPNATRTVERAGESRGLGDIVIRSKYHVLSGAGGGLSAAVDVRLPTGDEEELLGAGGVQTKVMLIASTEQGRFGEHVNFGYTAARGAVGGSFAGLTAAPLPDEINYSGGATFVAHPRVTVMAEMVGRTLRGAGRLRPEIKGFQFADPSRPGGTCNIFPFECSTASFEEFALQPGNLNLLLGSGAVKFNPVGNLIVSANVLFPISKAGLRSHVTTVFGIDYAF